MLSAFRSCPRKFFHEFVEGLRPGEISIDLHAGACFATALETFYHCHYVLKYERNDAIRATMSAFNIAWGDIIAPEKSPKTQDRVWAAVLDYIGTYPPERDHVQPYFTENMPTFEVTFAIPLEAADGFPLHPSGANFVYSGRFDMLGEYAHKPVVRDEKTAKALDSRWAEKWDLRGQFLGYCWACQHLGVPVDTVVVRGVIIQKTQIRQVEAIKVYPDFLIDRWYRQLQADMWRMVRCYETTYFDYNFGETCTQYGFCPYMQLCSSKHTELWKQDYVIRHWNPLQKDPTSMPTSPTYQVLSDNVAEAVGG